MGKVEFGQCVRELRQSCELTQADLADMLGVDHTYISKIENSTILALPITPIIEHMAQVLGVNPEYLLDVAGKLDTVRLEYMASKSPLITSILRRIQRGLTDEQIQQMLQILESVAE